MKPFVIHPVVEGHGEIAAVEILLGRLLSALGVWGICRTPSRLPKDQMVADEEAFKWMLDLIRYDTEVSLALFLYDADDNCARDHVPQMRLWAEEANLGIPCHIVMIRREFEAWFLAALPSLQGKELEHGERVADIASFAGAPEAKRDAKSAVGDFILPKKKYRETLHQAQLTRHLDLQMAYRSAPTFRRLVQAIVEALQAQGHEPILPGENWVF
jgi:hypothetical protein